MLDSPPDQYGLLHNKHKQTKPAEFDRLHPPRRSHVRLEIPNVNTSLFCPRMTSQCCDTWSDSVRGEILGNSTVPFFTRISTQPCPSLGNQWMDWAVKDENRGRDIFGRVTPSPPRSLLPSDQNSLWPTVMRSPLLLLSSFHIIFFASTTRGRAKFKPSVFDTSPWLPIGEVTRNLWQPLLEKLNQGRQSKSLVRDALVGEDHHLVGESHQFVSEDHHLVGEDHHRNFSSESVVNKTGINTDALLPQGSLNQHILSNSTSWQKSGSTSFQKIHKNLKRRKKSERYGARLSEEASKTTQPVHKVFPNDPKYPSDHNFKEDPIFVVLNSSPISESRPDARFSRSPFIGGAELENRWGWFKVFVSSSSSIKIEIMMVVK